MPNKYMTLAEVATELRISYHSARRAVLDGRLEAIQLGGPKFPWRVDRRSYRDFLTKSRKDGGDGGTDDRTGCNNDDITKAG